MRNAEKVDAANSLAMLCIRCLIYFTSDADMTECIFHVFVFFVFAVMTECIIHVIVFFVFAVMTECLFWCSCICIDVFDDKDMTSHA